MRADGYSRFVKHLPCQECGSSDGNALYDDGHTHCFVCDTTRNKNNLADFEPQVEVQNARALKMRPLGKDFTPLPDRKISEATARKYGVQFQPDEQVQHVYPYYDKGGRHIANKCRLQGPEKRFVSEGLFTQATLFGQQLFPPGSAQAITVVEGECDAMAAFELTGSRFPCVSVHNSSGAAKCCADNFEYLNSFDKIVVCMDTDEPKVNPKTGEIRYPGQEAALAIAALPFPLGKLHILTLADGKDPNDYLIRGKQKEFISEWWKAPRYTPTGLKVGRDMWDEVKTPRKFETAPYPWESLNKMTYGLRLSEFVLVTGETGDGKTSIIKEIEHHLLNHTNVGLGLLHMEESNPDTALGLMSITANKPLHLPDVRENIGEEELRKYFDQTMNNDRVVLYDHFGSTGIHVILDKVRHMHALGCKYIILDHLSIIVSDQSGDERKQLDEISTKLKTLCMELNLAVIAVIHLNRQGLIRSSAGPEQLANMVMKIHRQKKDLDERRRNITKIVIEKNRFCGRTGPATYLFYDNMTGRLSELSKEDADKYEAGATGEEKW